MNNQEQERKCLTLFVGEGDFSFSANYIIKYKSYHEKIYASCWSNQTLTDGQHRNINIINENGGSVFTNVDATHLEGHQEIKKLQFSKIIFNFPHVTGKMNIRKNRHLLEKFFLSCKNVLKRNGMVLVTLCQGQGGTDIEKVKRKWSDTWKIVAFAASASFVLYSIQPFNASEFDTYQCTGFRGLQKPFNTKGALTHVFILGNPLCLKNNIYSYLDIKLYLQNCDLFYKNIYCNPSHPCKKMSCTLSSIAEKIFHSVHQETICDMITCIESLSLNFEIDCTDSNFVISAFCNKCLKYLTSLFLNKKKSHCITSIKCTICCIENISVNNFPFCSLQGYFSDDIDNLLNNLPTFLKCLKQTYSLNINNCNSHNKIDFFHNTCEEFLSQGSAIKETSVKKVFSLYATCTVYQGEKYFFYSDVDFFFVKDDAYNESKSDVFKIASLLEINDNVNRYFCILFDINVLSCLKYHIMDYRALLSESSFYSSEVLRDISEILYRSFSIYPLTFIHDVSFYVDQDFNENDLHVVVRNAIGYLIKSVQLIDSYYNDNLQKQSRCYRFIYQSCDLVLSKDKADYIHTEFMRKILESSLNVSLR